jgi:hypothetical protein
VGSNPTPAAQPFLRNAGRNGVGFGSGRFKSPTDLTFNRGLIADPEAFARDANAASWLFLCGEEFSAMEGGMSYASVQAAVPESANVVSDPPRVLDTDLARQQVAALDQLPRPTLVTCRRGASLVRAGLPLRRSSSRRLGGRSAGASRGGRRALHPIGRAQVVGRAKPRRALLS